MDNNQANTQLGTASRGLAFALVEQVAGKDWRNRDVTKLQEALYEYGEALARRAAIIATGPISI